MEPDPSCVRAGFRNRLYEGNDNTAEASSRRQSGALAGRCVLLPPHSTRYSSPPNRPTPGWSANRKLAYTGLLLGKKSRLSGRILRVAEIAQADANQAKPLVRAEADTFPQ